VSVWKAAAGCYNARPDCSRGVCQPVHHCDGHHDPSLGRASSCIVPPAVELGLLAITPVTYVAKAASLRPSSDQEEGNEGVDVRQLTRSVQRRRDGSGHVVCGGRLWGCHPERVYPRLDWSWFS
jgi:hypothetical protein